MSLIIGLIRYKKFFFVLFFFILSFSISKKTPNRKISNNKCEYGEEYIRGKCIKPSFDMIPEAIIDEDGIYKYIQIKCNKEFIYIRGRKDCQYHRIIYSKFLKEVETNHLDKKFCKCLGGGRIKKNIKSKTIEIYGYSKKYGRVKNQHEKTKQILQKFYPDYAITWSNEGY